VTIRSPRVVVACVVLLSAVPTPTAAQRPADDGRVRTVGTDEAGATGRWSVAGHVAWSQVSDDEGSLGSGTSFGGALGYRLGRRWEVQVRTDRTTHERTAAGGQVRWNGDATELGMNVLARFRGGTTVQPFVGGGVSVVRYTGTACNPCAGAAVPSDPSYVAPAPAASAWSATGRGFTGTAGVEVFVRPTLSIQPDVRVTFSGVSAPRSPEPPISLFCVGVAAAYHW